MNKQNQAAAKPAVQQSATKARPQAPQPTTKTATPAPQHTAKPIAKPIPQPQHISAPIGQKHNFSVISDSQNSNNTTYTKKAGNGYLVIILIIITVISILAGLGASKIDPSGLSEDFETAYDEEIDDPMPETAGNNNDGRINIANCAIILNDTAHYQLADQVAAFETCYASEQGTPVDAPDIEVTHDKIVNKISSGLNNPHRTKDEKDILEEYYFTVEETYQTY